MKRLALLALAAGSALAASAAAPDFRAPPLGSAGLATNHIMTWAGYTLGGRKNGYNDHVYLDLPENQNDLTVCSWVAVLDADGADHRPDGQGGGARRASNVLPALYYSPNIERAAPDLLGGAWGWGGSPVAVSGSLSFDYRFPAAGTSGGGGGLGDLVMTCENFTSRYLGYTLGPLNGTYRFTVPFETDMGWTGYVLEGQTPPANMGDLSSMEPVICDPATGGNLVMLWGEGLHDQLSIKDLYTDHPSVDHYFDESYSGTISFARVSAEPPFWESVAWNGGVTGTNCFPRGVYTVAWTNLSSTMTLTAGGTDMTLEAPAGVRNVEPGEADGFVLTGSGTAQVGISRMKIEPFYKTDGDAIGGGDSAATQSYNDALVSSNFCFVAHRVHLDASTHTNDLVIVQGGGSRRSWGSAPELPPDGCGSLRTNGLYQLVYSAFGDLQATYVYEWDRRQFAAWLSDDDLAAIYEDGARIRLAHGYPSCVHSNAVYQPDP